MDKSSMFLRFPLRYRIEHWILAVNFSLLALTGLVQFFATSPVAQTIVGFLGGVENVRHIHHVCAMILILQALVHVGVTRYRAFITLTRSTITPGLNDAVAAFRAFAYNLGFSKVRTKQGRYTFAEKAEYWAVVWGTIIMAVTGFMMWNPVATTRWLPGQFIPAAKVAHGYEALLAVLAIIVWHFYFVLIKYLNTSMFTGYVTEEEMLREHPLELADIRSGIAPKPIDPEARLRYWRFDFPLYSAVAVFLFGWAVYFAYFEQTSIEKIIPPEFVTVFRPVAPPQDQKVEPGRLPGGFDVANISWESGISDIFATNCASCHGIHGAGGLDVTEYQSALSSGAIVRFDPDGSPIVTMMEAGGHQGELSGSDLAMVHIWISHGAPLKPGEKIERPAETVEQPQEVPSLTWATGIAAIFSASCGSCHGSMSLGGLNLTDYKAAMDSGVITPADPGASKLIAKMEAGGHPGHLSEQDLSAVRKWIQDGAPSGPLPPPEQEKPAPEEEKPEEPPVPVRPRKPQTIPDYYWDTDIQRVFEKRCTSCHGESAMAGMDFRTYESLMAARIIVAGDPDSSRLIDKIEVQRHPRTLTTDEISMIRAWIWNGAPQSATEAPPSPPQAAAPAPSQPSEPTEPPPQTPAPAENLYTWNADVASIFAPSCTSCHGSSAMGGLDLSTYATVIAAGVVTPGEPATSKLVLKVEKGDHYAQLTSEQLDIIRQWILDGAKEK